MRRYFYALMAVVCLVAAQMSVAIPCFAEEAATIGIVPHPLPPDDGGVSSGVVYPWPGTGFEERVNIYAHELLITDSGIYLNRAGEALPLTAVYADAHGLYIKVNPKHYYHTQCRNGHEIYHQACGGCANWSCPGRCKCYTAWICQ